MVIKNLFCLLLVGLFFSCTKVKTVKVIETQKNKPLKKQNIFFKPKQRSVLLNSYPSKKPTWLYETPEIKKGYLIFVSVSEGNATEKDARKSALRNAVLEFANYCGVQVKDLYKSISSSYGLDSDIKNPTKAEITSTEMYVDAYVSRIKAKKWYIEKWGYIVDNDIIEKYYKAYIYATIPENEYNIVKKNKK